VIRIVGVQRSESVEREFVLLQNQGSLRAALKGHMLVADEAMRTGDVLRGSHLFTDDVLVPAGMYVILISGAGTPRWGKTRDGAHVYHVYMNQTRPLWSRCDLPLHLLHTQHSYSERTEGLLMR
jgi:hypothetical protein